MWVAHLFRPPGCCEFFASPGPRPEHAVFCRPLTRASVLTRLASFGPRRLLWFECPPPF